MDFKLAQALTWDSYQPLPPPRCGSTRLSKKLPTNTVAKVEPIPTPKITAVVTNKTFRNFFITASAQLRTVIVCPSQPHF